MMARAHFVKKARKDNPACKAGESYYWWSFRFGGKHYSLKPPRASQLTQSEFLGAIYTVKESMEDFTLGDGVKTTESAKDDFESAIEGWVSEIESAGEVAQEGKDAMPEGLQEGDVGQMLEGRVDSAGEWASELQGIDLDPEDNETFDNYVERIQSEIQNSDYQGE
jgi:hypothetical protein